MKYLKIPLTIIMILTLPVSLFIILLFYLFCSFEEDFGFSEKYENIKENY